MPAIPVLRVQRQKDLSKCEVSLVYIVSSITAQSVDYIVGNKQVHNNKRTCIAERAVFREIVQKGPLFTGWNMKFRHISLTRHKNKLKNTLKI